MSCPLPLPWACRPAATPPASLSYPREGATTHATSLNSERDSHVCGRQSALTPLYVKTRVLSGLGDGLACAEGCHDALVDLSRKEAFQASDDLAFGPAIGGASGDVVAGWLVESHADDDGSIEGGVGVSVTAPIEPMPAGGSPGRGRDRSARDRCPDATHLAARAAR